MNRWRLSARADRDLVDLVRFGDERFGDRQTDRYVAALEHTFDLIARQPRMGRLAPNIAPEVRRHEYRSHVVLYEADDFGVTILALVHQSSVRQLKL